LATCLISTIISGPNNLSAQLVYHVVFHLGSFHMLPDSGCWLSPYTTAPLHPLIAPPHGNQEPPCMLLSPFRMGAAPSSLLLETNALNNELHSPSIVSPPRYRLPSLPYPIKGVGTLIIHCRIHSLLPLSFSYTRTLYHQTSSCRCNHSSLPGCIHRSTAPSYDR
jgi:hypothetical protein